MLFDKMFGKKGKQDSAAEVTPKLTEKAAPKKAETPKAEAPKKAAAPKAEAPKKAVTPKVEAPKEEKPAAAEKGSKARFEIKKTKNDKYVFNLFAANGVIVATSQTYSSAQAAKVGIDSVIANAETAPVEDQTLKDFTPVGYPKWEIYIDKGGKYEFRLSATNGNTICHSQGYTTKASCKNGIDSIITNAKVAALDKAYLKKI